MANEQLEHGDFLEPWEVANYMGVSCRTLESWRQRGTGPVYFKIGKLVRYSTKEIDAFLAESRVVPEPVATEG